MHILWISPYVPYDTVGHAGGQNHNYYLKYVKKHTNYDITLISICEEFERDKIDLDQYSIDGIIRTYDRKSLLSRVQNMWGKLQIKRDGGLLGNRKYHLLLSALHEYAKTGKTPDVIISQWTDVALMYAELKALFPHSKYVAIEEDVAFLGYQRKYENAKGLYRFYKKLKYEYLKAAEIGTLKKYDIVVALNDNDRELLVREGICSDNILRMSSYHGLYKDTIYNPDLHRLLFYGAMSRPENYQSAIWFIENVMSKLDKSYSLYIVGSNPPEVLTNYESERIIVTGYVDSIAPYFEQCLCLVAPLLLGAGTKIKVLEALSAGVPVVTNDIGAEGISLTSGENYIHCNTADEYATAICELTTNSELRGRLSRNGRSHVERLFDVDSSLNMLIDRIRSYEK